MLFFFFCKQRTEISSKRSALQKDAKSSSLTFCLNFLRQKERSHRQEKYPSLRMKTSMSSLTSQGLLSLNKIHSLISSFYLVSSHELSPSASVIYLSLVSFHFRAFHNAPNKPYRFALPIALLTSYALF